MPEGPEIRREADALAKVLVGQRVLGLYFEPPRLAHYRDQLLDRQVLAVDTRGKAMLTRFDNDLTLYSHNQLYGRWYVKPSGQEPSTRRTLRVALHTAAGSAFLYSATDVHVYTDADLGAHPFLGKLGPDVLNPVLDAKAVAARLMSAPFAKRALGGLYLDQGFMAGIGNYLRSEILFFAGLAPSRRPVDLTRAELNALARATLAVSQRAYAARGITNPAPRVAALKSQGLRYSDFRFAVFGRAAEPCFDCGTAIERTTVTTRRLYYCPNCQR